jgi:REP element-mobilizing transposase RayT
MPYDPTKHNRRSIRLKGYQYNQPGSYFVTFCVRERVCELGDIIDGEMRLSQFGQVALDFWAHIPAHFPNVEVDKFIIMPNHVHAIIVIKGGRGDVSSPPSRDVSSPPSRDVSSPPSRDVSSPPSDGEIPPIPFATLGQIVGYYKYQTTLRINQLRDNAGTPFWQRGYYERIIRNQRALQNIQDYILENPLNWELDQENPGVRRSSK